MAKRKQAKGLATSSSSSENHLSLVTDNKYTISEMQKDKQQMFHGLAGSIRQLMATHNALFDSASGQSVSNQNAVKQAAAVLECTIDQKIDYMNEFVSQELDSVRTRVKPKISPLSTRSKAMRKAWRLRKSKKSGKNSGKKNVQKRTKRAKR